MVRRLLALVLAVVGVAALAEGAVRALEAAPPDRVGAHEPSANPILAYVPQRLKHLPKQPAAPGVERVVLLGDEAIERLPLHGEDGVEIVNLAVSGYCTRAQVELLAAHPELEPDRVVLVFAEDDYDGFNRSMASVRVRERAPAWFHEAWRWSHLMRVVSTRLDLYGAASDTPEARFEANLRAIGPDNVRRGLAELSRLSQERGFDAVVAIPRTVHDRRVERIAAEVGVDTLELGSNPGRTLGLLLR